MDVFVVILGRHTHFIRFVHFPVCSCFFPFLFFFFRIEMSHRPTRFPIIHAFTIQITRIIDKFSLIYIIVHTLAVYLRQNLHPKYKIDFKNV